jgi:ligand-binding sensor domain-containing protein/signal transduction histidine kinase
MPNGSSNDRTVSTILQDRRGALWVAAASRIYRMPDYGRIECYGVKHGLPLNWIESLIEDRQGRLWAGTREGLYRIVVQPDPGRRVVERRYSIKDGLGADWVYSLFESSDGRLWAGTIGGLSGLLPKPDGEGRIFQNYTQTNGLSYNILTALTEDGEGNLWLGSEGGGAMKIVRSGFTTYTESDGLAGTHIQSVFEDRVGEFCAVSLFREPVINYFDGSRFHAIRPNYGRRITKFGWGWNQIVLQDHSGEWWLPTGEGLFRFPRAEHADRLARKAPVAVYGMRDGLPSGDIFRLFEDSHGDVWINAMNTRRTWVTRWERVTGSFHRYTDADGLPHEPSPTAFSEAPQGTLWMGFYMGGVARLRGGRFTTFTSADGVPESFVRQLHRDRAGRLWIATGNGLVRVDDPAAEHPSFATYRTAQGLSSDAVLCITEDQWGRIYVGTGRGVDRLDPGPGGALLGRIQHYTTADGLTRGTLNVAFRDRRGALWFGSLQGLSRFVPEPERPRSPPRVLLKALRIRGESYRISELGECDVAGLELRPQQNQVQIDFVGLGFGPGETLRYQYMLEGADLNWSVPTDQRTVNYASLAPGTYRFLVRAINSGGAASLKPATIAFNVLPPAWQRWWFRALAVFLLSTIVYAVHRYRVSRLLELERVRTRIATDLHDDIGSSLSQIVILSEVLNRRMSADDGRFAEVLSQIAEVSRELVASMSDIVWAIDPNHDQMRDLTQRMRRFASDVFTARNIAFSFRGPGAGQDIKLGADMRRQIFLIFKESVNNIVHHSDCTHADIEFALEHDELVLRLSDNGKGLPPGTCDGHGLANMQARAKSLGGQVAVASETGQGTSITLRVPLGRLGACRAKVPI